MDFKEKLPVKILADLDTYFRKLEEHDLFSGVVIITRGDDTLYTGAFGYANRAWKVKNNQKIRYDTASVTKLFTAVAILQLIDRGVLTMETCAVKLLGLENTSISESVNVFHLLTHTSGIGDDCEEENDEVYEDFWETKPNYSITETIDFLPQFIHKPANFEPGQACRYCNCGYVLLGLMIEKITGESYREYIQEHIFTRAGMLDSGFFWLNRVNEGVAEGADPIRDEADRVVGWKKNIYSFPPIGSPDSGAYVTARDLDRFLRKIKAGGLISPELSTAFFTPQAHYKPMRNGLLKMYGLGMLFYLDTNGDVVCCQKEGTNSGVSSLIRHFPTLDTNVIILANMEDAAWEPVWKIHDMVMAGDFDPL